MNLSRACDSSATKIRCHRHLPWRTGVTKRFLPLLPCISTLLSSHSTSPAPQLIINGLSWQLCFLFFSAGLPTICTLASTLAYFFSQPCKPVLKPLKILKFPWGRFSACAPAPSAFFHSIPSWHCTASSRLDCLICWTLLLHHPKLVGINCRPSTTYHCTTCSLQQKQFPRSDYNTGGLHSPPVTARLRENPRTLFEVPP